VLALIVLVASMDRPLVAPPDVVTLAAPAEVELAGFLGKRSRRSAKVRLLAVDEDELLAGYRKKPGVHPWIGEHVGKFLHAGTLAWAQDRDARLRAKIDRVARGLVAAQEPDGYLGTYLPADRFQLKPGSDWDVWSHKYCLIGLLTYHRYTQDPASLRAARRAADRLIAEFGPGKRSIVTAGTHVGMAATSVLESVVELYRVTGEPRYLAFAKKILADWESPGGPNVGRALLAATPVHRVANGKAYEMLSNLVGLVDFGRVSKNVTWDRAAEHAWKDVRANQRYLTGTASHFEHFHPGPELPGDEGSNVGETCVTVTWMQLNAQLLRRTGEAKYGAELERSAFNHLAGAQRPDGGAWCYYTPLEGQKPYGSATNCCLSSGPRGMAMLPTLAYVRFGSREIGVNFLETSMFRTRIEGREVTLRQTYRWDQPNALTLRVDANQPVRMALRVRIPEWANSMRSAGAQAKEGWLRFPERTWRAGEEVKVSLSVTPNVVDGGVAVPGRSALTWGPFVLAYDEGRNPDGPFAGHLALPKAARLQVTGGSATEPPQFRTFLERADGPTLLAKLVPFAEAGASGTYQQVWLRQSLAGLPNDLNGLARESRSRPGNAKGSINDGRPETFVVTFDTGKPTEDWYALAWRQPVAVRRITFRHGKSFHDGGWFDASKGKPRVQVQRTVGGRWEDVGALESYPPTTAQSDAAIVPGEPFSVTLPESIRVVGVRVIGVPASGDQPTQAFSSCGDLSVEP